MKAVRLIEPGSPLETREIPVPEVTHLDCLVRVKAAGICHSDVHYREGRIPAGLLPITLGHEVAGIVEQVGGSVTRVNIGDRVILHYMVTCGECLYCSEEIEQFCTSGSMIGKNLDGGYAEYISVPERSVFLLPDEIPLEQGAIMMCSSATAFHALNKSRHEPGEDVAVWGVGGLGLSAVQLAKVLGARHIYAVDIVEKKLEMAGRFGAIPINASTTDPVAEIRKETGGRGVDVGIELVGLPATMNQAVRSLAIGGRVVIAGLCTDKFSIDPYKDLLGREAEIIGVSDHQAREIPLLIEWVRKGNLVLSEMISRTIALEPDAINDTMDRLENKCNEIRVVITP